MLPLLQPWRSWIEKKTWIYTTTWCVFHISFNFIGQIVIKIKKINKNKKNVNKVSLCFKLSLPPLSLAKLFIWTNLNPFSEKCYVLSLGEICNVVLERKIKTGKVYDNDNKITTTKNRHILIRITHPSLLLRRAKITKKLLVYLILMNFY